MTRRVLAVILGTLTVGSFLLVFIPAYLIRPFVAQSSRGLTIAYFLRSVSPGATLVLAGKATSGPLAADNLEPIQTLKDFWFDWKLYNSSTRVFNE
jgi:hypothetical protein